MKQVTTRIFRAAVLGVGFAVAGATAAVATPVGSTVPATQQAPQRTTGMADEAAGAGHATHDCGQSPEHNGRECGGCHHGKGEHHKGKHHHGHKGHHKGKHHHGHKGHHKGKHHHGQCDHHKGGHDHGHHHGHHPHGRQAADGNPHTARLAGHDEQAGTVQDRGAAQGMNAPMAPAREQAAPHGQVQGEAMPMAPARGQAAPHGQARGEAMPMAPARGQAAPDRPAQGQAGSPRTLPAQDGRAQDTGSMLNRLLGGLPLG